MLPFLLVSFLVTPLLLSSSKKNDRQHPFLVALFLFFRLLSLRFFFLRLKKWQAASLSRCFFSFFRLLSLRFFFYVFFMLRVLLLHPLLSARLGLFLHFVIPAVFGWSHICRLWLTSVFPLLSSLYIALSLYNIGNYSLPSSCTPSLSAVNGMPIPLVFFAHLRISLRKTS